MTEERFHWERPPHKYEEENEYWEDVPVIVCDQPECDYVASAYASQFVVHHSRHHEE